MYCTYAFCVQFVYLLLLFCGYFVVCVIFIFLFVLVYDYCHRVKAQLQ